MKELTDLQIIEELAYYLKDTVYRTNMNTNIYNHMVELLGEQQKRLKPVIKSVKADEIKHIPLKELFKENKKRK